MDTNQQNIIRRELGVTDQFDAKTVAERLITFLMDYMQKAGAKTYVLGVSGGIDSTTAALLAQEACRRRRAKGYDARFIAVRIPYGTQRDEDDAQQALSVIQPDEVQTINIKEATDGMLNAMTFKGDAVSQAAAIDFTKGNIKARQRMIAQYAIAGMTSGLVIGTDHAAEALMGFFTKFGDGACDITPLTGLNKRRVRAVGAHLGAPDNLVFKVPTADLEDLDPGKPDEKSYGVSYDTIDDYLEGKQISAEAEAIILAQYRKTAHKRAQPVCPG